MEHVDRFLSFGRNQHEIDVDSAIRDHPTDPVQQARRIVRHQEPSRGDRPELSDAQRILAEEAARRESIFQQSVAAERTRGDALSKRFEEALRQANQEPVSKPMRDFDLD